LNTLLKLPWTLTMSGTGFGSVLGPAILAVIPAGLWVERWKTTAKILLGYIIFYTVLWLVFVLQLPYLIPAIAASTLLVAWTFHSVTAGMTSRRARYAYSALALVALIAMRLDAGVRANEPARATWTRASVGMGSTGTDAYLSRELGGTWEVVGYINSKLPRRAKILGINERQGLYCDRDFVSGDFLGIFGLSQKAETRYKQLRRMRVTHVLHVSKPETEQTATVESDVEAGYLKAVYAASGVQLLEVQRKPIRHAPCREGRPTVPAIGENLLPGLPSPVTIPDPTGRMMQPGPAGPPAGGPRP
jgi:hypothetical protein